jgi:hypothetical protein
MTRKRRPRRVAAGPHFIQLETWILRTDAFRALSGSAAKLLFLLLAKFNGQNNSEIVMSVRQAAHEVGCSPNHASKLFRELQEKGLVKIAVRGAFSLKMRHASTWTLTWLPVRRADHTGLFHVATRDFAHWGPSAPNPKKAKQNAVASRATDGTTA